MAREDKMIEAVKAKSNEKLQYLRETVDEMVAKDIPVTPYSVGKATGLSKTFIYGNEEAKEYIEKHRSKERYNERRYNTVEDLQNQVKTLTRENSYAQRTMDKLNDELLQELIAENQRLKEIVCKYEKLVEMGLLKIPEDMKL